MGLIIIIRCIQLKADIIIHGYALHNSFDWSFHLLGAFWELVLDSTTVPGFVLFKDQGFYVACTESRVVLKETNETYDYRIVSSQRWL